MCIMCVCTVIFEFHRHVLCSMSESIFLLLFLLDEAAVCNASLNHPSSRYTRFAKVAGDASKSRAWEHNQSFPLEPNVMIVDRVTHCSSKSGY